MLWTVDRATDVLPRALTPKERAVIQALDPYYQRKHFEYVEPGFKSLPPLAAVRELTDWMIADFPSVVRQRLKARG